MQYAVIEMFLGVYGMCHRLVETISRPRRNLSTQTKLSCRNSEHH